MRMTPERIAAARSRCAYQHESLSLWAREAAAEVWALPAGFSPADLAGLIERHTTAAVQALTRTDLPDALADLEEARAEIERLQCLCGTRMSPGELSSFT